MSTRDEERAREAAESIVGVIVTNGDASDDEMRVLREMRAERVNRTAAIIAQALADARREAMEEAAKICDELQAQHHASYLEYYDVQAFHLANLDKMAETRVSEAAAAIRECAQCKASE